MHKKLQHFKRKLNKIRKKNMGIMNMEFKHLSYFLLIGCMKNWKTSKCTEYLLNSHLRMYPTTYSDRHKNTKGT